MKKFIICSLLLTACNNDATIKLKKTTDSILNKMDEDVEKMKRKNRDEALELAISTSESDNLSMEQLQAYADSIEVNPNITNGKPHKQTIIFIKKYRK